MHRASSLSRLGRLFLAGSAALATGARVRTAGPHWGRLAPSARMSSGTSELPQLNGFAASGSAVGENGEGALRAQLAGKLRDEHTLLAPFLSHGGAFSRAQMVQVRRAVHTAAMRTLPIGTS